MSEWISVKEKLPENVDFVLVYLPENDSDLDSKITAAAWYHGCWNGPVEEYNAEMVTHWMPLPAPPMTSAAKSVGKSNEENPKTNHPTEPTTTKPGDL